MMYLLFTLKKEAQERSKKALFDFDPTPIEGTCYMFGFITNGNLWALCIEMRYQNLLTENEIESLQDYKQLKEMGFFPEII